ncbi:C6 finger domain transcription factor BOA13 [Fusarium oxysporum f. sp. albedinis]|nr:C6 finger domain transcription factor BOA13 [Fusarium oxysporum f. sp. albedinis]
MNTIVVLSYISMNSILFHRSRSARRLSERQARERATPESHDTNKLKPVHHHRSCRRPQELESPETKEEKPN